MAKTTRRCVPAASKIRRSAGRRPRPPTPRTPRLSNEAVAGHLHRFRCAICGRSTFGRMLVDYGTNSVGGIRVPRKHLDLEGRPCRGAKMPVVPI